MRYLLLAAILLSSCGISPADVQATIDALPTHTAIPTSTSTPEPTATDEPARSTAFVISLDIAKDQLEDWGYSDLGTTECFVKSTPVWAFCHSYVYGEGGGILSAVQLTHDGKTLLGLAWLEEYDLSSATSSFYGATIIDITVHFRVPLVFFGNQRNGDFYYFSSDDADGKMHIWLDYRLAEVMCSNPMYCN